MLIRIALVLVALAVLAFGLTLLRLCLLEKRAGEAQAGETEALVVLGAQVRPDGTPSVQLQWRLDQALEAWQAHPVWIVTCGAQGGDEPAPEGEVMQADLASRGVPAEQILVDASSFNTWENLKNARRLLDGRASRITVVTSDYHLPRALDMARQLGFEAEGVGSPTLPSYWIKNHFREVLSWWKYWGQKYLGWFGGLKP